MSKEAARRKPTMRLEHALSHLCGLMPGRVLSVRETYVTVQLYGRPVVLMYDERRDLDVLEMALREECVAQGWVWNLEYGDWPHEPRYRASVAGPRAHWEPVEYAHSPSHALALVLVKALVAAKAGAQ